MKIPYPILFILSKNGYTTTTTIYIFSTQQCVYYFVELQICQKVANICFCLQSGQTNPLLPPPTHFWLPLSKKYVFAFVCLMFKWNKSLQLLLSSFNRASGPKLWKRHSIERPPAFSQPPPSIESIKEQIKTTQQRFGFFFGFGDQHRCGFAFVGHWDFS